MDGSMVMGPSAIPHRTPTRKIEIKSINLALQGGGAHGAFTWGVLDRLLEDERIRFDGISATSAGAMNATALAAGMAVGGHKGARKALARLWRRVSHAASTSPLQPSLLERLFGNHSMAQSVGFVFFEMMTRLFSPYEFNPLNRNPLRQVLLDSVDFEALSPATCRSSCTWRRQTSAPERSRSSTIPISLSTRCSPQRVCRSSSRPSRSTARLIGTAATLAIRRSSR